MKYRPLKERFNEKYKINAETGCWDWTAATINGTYGNIGGERGPNHRMMLAHRVSYELNVGPIPDGKFVLHECDNMLCVNPDHLFVSDHQGNMTDMAQKGRARLLSSDQVKDAEYLVTRGRSQASIGKMFGVSRMTISLALKKARDGDYGPENATANGGGYTKLTDIQKQEIVDHLKNGRNLSVVAKEYNVDRKTIRNIRSTL